LGEPQNVMPKKPTWPEHPVRLRQSAVESLPDAVETRRDVERRIVEGQVEHVAETEVAGRGPRAGDDEQRLGCIETRNGGTTAGGQVRGESGPARNVQQAHAFTDIQPLEKPLICGSCVWLYEIGPFASPLSPSSTGQLPTHVSIL
jgi:hypothetical protein